MNLTTGLIKTGILMAGITALFLVVGHFIGGTSGVLIALGLSIAMNAFAYWNSDTLALRAHGAQPVTASSAPELITIVDQLAERADLPMPRVFVINDEQPNAFATGRSPEKAALAVTTGLMHRLEQNELAGVIAHELAHIKNRDTLIMTVTATFAGAIAFLAQSALFMRGRQGPGGVIGALVIALFAPLAAGLIQMMISRTREYAADREGAEICGEPMWLASALAKIARGVSTNPMRSAEGHPATAHIFIHNPLTGGGIDDLFATHPRTENRIAALEALARDMRRTDELAANRSWAQGRSRVQY